MANNRISVIVSVLGLGLLFTILFIAYLLNSIDHLGATIKEKDLIINNGLVSNKNKVQKLTDTVKQFTDKYEYIIEGKTVGTDGFIKLYNNLQNEKEEYKILFEAAKKRYGFIEERTKIKDGFAYGFKVNTRADSADITYQLFKNRIYRKDGKWYADLTSRKDLKDYQDDVDKKLRALLDTTKKVNNSKQ